jgi:hypothetical protein
VKGPSKQLDLGGRAATELAFPERAARDTDSCGSWEDGCSVWAQGARFWLGMRYGRPFHDGISSFAIGSLLASSSVKNISDLNGFLQEKTGICSKKANLPWDTIKTWFRTQHAARVEIARARYKFVDLHCSTLTWGNIISNFLSPSLKHITTWNFAQKYTLPLYIHALLYIFLNCSHRLVYKTNIILDKKLCEQLQKN